MCELFIKIYARVFVRENLVPVHVYTVAESMGCV